jgi:hypothetical protein
MGYSNSFSLKIKGFVDKSVKVSPDSCGCNLQLDELNINFCFSCGQNLLTKSIKVEPDFLISKLREVSENAKFLLSNSGRTNNSGNGYYLIEDISKFSKDYEDLTFVLKCDYEEGGPSEYHFIKNGESKKAKINLSYEDPFTGEVFKKK